MFYEYFLQVCGLSYSLTLSLTEQKFLILMKSDLSIFLSCIMLLVLHLKGYLNVWETRLEEITGLQKEAWRILERCLERCF